MFAGGIASFVLAVRAVFNSATVSEKGGVLAVTP
jgi:hypothetical protein